MNGLKTMKISELIAALEELKSEAGDLPIVMSSDEEGNSFGTFSADGSFGYESGVATLWPYEGCADLDGIEGYVPDDGKR